MSTMASEIRQQPEAIEKTLKAEWRKAVKLREYFAQHPVRLVVLAARGTSDNAAQFGRYLLEISTGIPVSLAAPSVITLYGSKVNLQDAAVIAVSQSGESTDTNIVLEKAKASGAFTAGITNEAESTLAKLSDHTFLVRAGKERSVAATKTYTGQLLCFYLLAYALGAPLELTDLQRLADWTDAALKLEKEITERVQRYRSDEACGLCWPRAELWELFRVCAQIDGDLLCGGRTVFVRRSAARPHRHARIGISRFCFLSARRNVESHSGTVDQTEVHSSRDTGDNRPQQQGGRRQGSRQNHADYSCGTFEEIAAA